MAKPGKHAVVAALLTYLLVSFVPQISLMNLLGKKPPKTGG